MEMGQFSNEVEITRNRLNKGINKENFKKDEISSFISFLNTDAVA